MGSASVRFRIYCNSSITANMHILCWTCVKNSQSWSHALHGNPCWYDKSLRMRHHRHSLEKLVNIVSINYK